MRGHRGEIEQERYNRRHGHEVVHQCDGHADHQAHVGNDGIQRAGGG